jgi:hypothetical protein
MEDDHPAPKRRKLQEGDAIRNQHIDIDAPVAASPRTGLSAVTAAEPSMSSAFLDHWLASFWMPDDCQLLIPNVALQQLLRHFSPDQTALLVSLLSDALFRLLPDGPPIISHSHRILFDDLHNLNVSPAAAYVDSSLGVHHICQQFQIDWAEGSDESVTTFARGNAGTRFCVHFMRSALMHTRTKSTRQSYAEVWEQSKSRTILVDSLVRTQVSGFRRRDINKQKEEDHKDDDTNDDDDQQGSKGIATPTKFLDSRAWFNTYSLRFGSCGNFLPVVAKQFYEQFDSSVRHVFDPCAGFGGRLVGAWLSRNVETYVGIDPNTRLQQPFHDMIHFLMRHFPPSSLASSTQRKKQQTVEIITSPAEDVDAEYVLSLTPGSALFDLAFTSPPYFDKEHYNDNESSQSNIRYPTFNGWRDGFLYPMLRLCAKVLRRPGGLLALNVDASLTTDVYSFVTGQLNMRLRAIQLMPFRSRPSRMQQHDRAKKGSGLQPTRARRYDPILLFETLE